MRVYCPEIRWVHLTEKGQTKFEVEKCSCPYQISVLNSLYGFNQLKKEVFECRHCKNLRVLSAPEIFIRVAAKIQDECQYVSLLLNQSPPDTTCHTCSRVARCISWTVLCAFFKHIDTISTPASWNIDVHRDWTMS